MRLRFVSFLALALVACGGGGGTFRGTDGGACSALCGGKCADTSTDPNNCGTCNKACGFGQRCAGGQCVSTLCMSPADCDDKISCTIDTCMAGFCRHAVGPNSGPTSCPGGEFCVIQKGCIKGKACGGDGDCIDMDPCTVFEHCEQSTAICTYQILDSDGDGHPPVICGGDDCDDADPDRYPGHPEICDGVDNGCTGMVDVNATCTSQFEACMNGACSCKPENTCGGNSCLDRDPLNCGTCGNLCPQGGQCTNGACQCFNGQTSCNGSCTDTNNDPMNCGQCGVSCGQSGLCTNGGCQCNFGSSMCNGMCANVKTDPANCGVCGMSCSVGCNCVNGLCQLTCNDILNCEANCNNDQNCITNCINRGTAKGTNLLNTLLNCLYAACPSANNNDPCFDYNSQVCITCWNGAQAGNGACVPQLNACGADQ